MRRSLAFLLILLMSTPLAENVAADSLYVGEVTSDRVALTWSVHWGAEKYILHIDKGDGWEVLASFDGFLRDDYTVTGLDSGETYRFMMRTCLDASCLDSHDSNIVEVRTDEDPWEFYLVCALGLVVVSSIVIAIVALWAFVTRRD